MQKHPVVFSDKALHSRSSVSMRGTLYIEKPVAHVWEVITTPGYLELVHPFCKFHEKVAWNTVGQVDSGEFYSGEKLTRKLTQITKEEGYEMDVIGNKNKKSKIIFSLKKNTTLKGTDFSIHLTTQAFNKMPRPLWKIFIKRKVESNLEVYLSSLLNGIKFYAETGIPVTKNQFGNLKLVSP